MGYYNGEAKIELKDKNNIKKGSLPLNIKFVIKRPIVNKK